MALGAFLAGMVVGRSEFSLRAASDALPMRDAFAVLFFVSVGMLFDPRRAARRRRASIAGALAIVLVGKPLVGAARSCWLLRYPLKDGADGRDRAGADRRVLVHPRDARPRARRSSPPAATNTLVAASIVSIVAESAALPRDRAGRTVGRSAAGAGAAAQSADPRSEPESGRPRRRRSRAIARLSSATARPAAPWSGCCRTTRSRRPWWS